jgi:GntR family transcriptional regulator/MocR family aminotransferase
MILDINRNSTIPIKKQLYDALTYKILRGEFEHGQKLPSSRQLSEELNIARNTVVEIYEQLIAEAYLVTRKGSGTFVSETGQIKFHTAAEQKPETKREKRKPDLISLVAGTPDLSRFPQKAWQNAYRDVAYQDQAVLHGYGNAFGYRTLRETLAKYLLIHKGIHASYRQIIITSGTKDALRLLAMSLKGQYNHLITESPCIRFAVSVFKAIDYGILPVPVDQEGLVVDALPANTTPSLIYTSPSHQFPIGGTMSFARRNALIEYARSHGHLVIEDDYDSEFRYRGAPVNALFQLSNDDVIHVGTFSKTISPSLRLGYMVLPEKILEQVRSYQYMVGNPPPTLNQVVVSEMFANGSYEKHLYKMNKIYKVKMAAITKYLRAVFGDTNVTINGENSGLHISVKFDDISFSGQHQQIFSSHGIRVNLCSDYAMDGKDELCDTLVLGFGHLQLDEITKAVTGLKNAIEEIRSEQGE